MKIIKKPTLDGWTHKIICPQCTSELEAEPSDIKYHYYPGDFRDPSYESFHVNCPVCDRVIDIPTKSIPALLQIQCRKNGRK